MIDRKGRKIKVGDIVEIGEPLVKNKGRGTVIYRDGILMLEVDWLEPGHDPIPLRAYCNEAFNNCIEIISSIKEQE